MVSKSRIIVLIALLTCSFGQHAHGAEVVLRKHATLSGAVVRLGDVADVSAASSATLRDLTTTPLLPAPAPGSQQFLNRTQIRDLLISRGVDVQTLRLSGAAVVEVGKEASPALSLVSENSSPETKLEVEAALQAAIIRHLINRTGHDLWDVIVREDKSARQMISKSTGEFSVEGGRQPWTGTQRFQIGTGGTGQRVVVQATVKKIQRVLFARRAIQRGDVIRAADVEVRQYEENLPHSALSALDQVVGMVAARSIAADAIIVESHVRAPLQVQRGETVTVYARTGGIAVRTYVVARQDGAMGELVQVETLDNKQRFAARVSGRRRLEVLATGARAEDFATLKTGTQRR